jgi:Right handed beta helix region
VIGAESITVDLNGQTIDGTVAAVECVPPADPHNGIDNTAGFDRITVENGTIREFEFGINAGSDTAGMSDSRLHDLTLSNNGDGISMGSGARPAATSGDRIDHNIVTDSDCTGIGLVSGRRNRVDGNHVERADFGVVVCCGASDDRNIAQRNTVADADIGIVVFSTGSGRISDNTVTDIAEVGVLVTGETTDELVTGNGASRTQGPGISVESCCERGPRLKPSDVHVVGNSLTGTGEGIVLFESEGDESATTSSRAPEASARPTTSASG